MSIKQLAIGMTACAFVCSTQIAQAEEQIIEIEGVASGRLYADTSFQDCCDLDSFAYNETSIPVGPCATKGGYCISGTKIASWMFQMPELEPGSMLLSATFDGRHAGGSAAFTLRGKWFTTESYGYSSALQGWNSPNFSGSVGNSDGNFSPPLPIDLDDGHWDADYLMLSAYRSSFMIFNNSGTLRPKIRLMVNVPDQSCNGDMNDDNAVNITDLLAVIAEWGNPYNVTDLLTVIEHWGSAFLGACCLSNGNCVYTDAPACEASGGSWNGSSSSCTVVNCP